MRYHSGNIKQKIIAFKAHIRKESLKINGLITSSNIGKEHEEKGRKNNKDKTEIKEIRIKTEPKTGFQNSKNSQTSGKTH